MRLSWSRAAAITTGKSGANGLAHVKSKAAFYGLGSGRSLLAVVRPMAVRAWPGCSVVPDGAIALPGSCARNASLPGSAPSIVTPPPTAVMADRSLRTVSKASAVRRPNQVWVTDATGVLTGQGWLYLVAVLDLYSRRVVGWAMSSILDAPLDHRCPAHGAAPASAGKDPHRSLRSREPVRQRRLPPASWPSMVCSLP